MLLAPLTTLRLYAADEIEYFVYLRSLVFDRDLDFTDEYRWFVNRDPTEYKGFADTFLVPKTPVGRAPNNAPIGSAILWAPFYVATVAAEKAVGAGGTPAGYSKADISAVCLASMVYGVLGLLLTQEICRCFASERAAFWATTVLWLSTNLLFYMYVTPPMSHANSFFTASLFLWWWLRGARDWRHAVVLGAVAGLMATVRWQDGLLVVAPISAPVFSGEVRDRASLRRWLAWISLVGVASLITFLPQLIVWYLLNGSFAPFGVISVKGRFAFTVPYLLGIFFSPFHGLFVWSPILVPAFAGLLLLAAGDERGRGIALAVATQLYLLAGYIVAFGHSFGQRLFVSSLPAAAIGLGVFGERTAPRLPRTVVVGAAALSIWWNVSLMIQHSIGMIPRNEEVSLSTLLHNQFFEVPRQVPSVATRYLFDRASLYKVDPLRLPARRE